MLFRSQVSKGLEARKSQARERESIRAEMNDAQKNIDKLLDERAPLAQKIRNTEVEFGPIRYVAELIYGSSTPDVLDKAVRVMIIALVLVLDPLALLLIISANTNKIAEPVNSATKYDREAKAWFSANNKAVDARNWKEVDRKSTRLNSSH